MSHLIALSLSVMLSVAHVAPGKIGWHASYRDALAASATSGKPVLMFLLLGKLDDEFC
jgi:hypothetical protein